MTNESLFGLGLLEAIDMIYAVKPCPNRECGGECVLGDYYWVVCLECGYQGPAAETAEEAIRLHNLICTPPAGWKLVKDEPVAWLVRQEGEINSYVTLDKEHAERSCSPDETNIPTDMLPLYTAAPENDDEQT